MALINLVDCPNDNLKMYKTIRLIIKGYKFGEIAYNSINLRVIHKPKMGQYASAEKCGCMTVFVLQVFRLDELFR